MTKKNLRDVAQAIRCTDYRDYRTYLGAVFSAIKHQDSSYSYADFSRDLGLGSRNAHLVIHGKRDLTRHTGQKIIEALGILKEQRRYFLLLIDHDRARSSAERDQAYAKLLELKSKVLPTNLARQQLDFFNHWYHAAILELLRLEEASDDPSWIASELKPKVTVPQVKKSLLLLQELGYVDFDQQRGRLFPTAATIATGNEVRGMAIYRFHQQMMDLAKQAMDDVPPESREISAVTLAINPELRQQLKAEIAALRKKFVQMANQTSEPSEIVQVNFQLFPLATLEKK